MYVGDCQSNNQYVLPKTQAYKCEPKEQTNENDGNIYCPAVYQPVCDANGKEYPNSCIAKNRYGVTEYKDCSKQTNPNTDTCGTDPVCYEVSDGTTTSKKTFESECALKELFDSTSEYCKAGNCVYIRLTHIRKPFLAFS